MKPKQTMLAILTAILLAACGGEAPEPEATPAAAEAETAEATPAEAPIAEPGAPAESVLEVVEESAGDDETGQSAEADESAVGAVIEDEAPPAAAAQVDWRFEQGKHFTVLTTAQGTSGPPDVIEVAEVFWYGCPHCYNFDPYLARWQENLPDDVRFVRLPVMWNPTNQLHARVFYTAEALGKMDEIHEAVFREIHLNQKMLATEQEIEAFFARFGVTEEEFGKAFRSFAVDSKLNRAKALTQRYQVRSVPLLVVNGKYVANGPEVKSFEDIIAVTDELVDRERLRL